MSSQLLTSVMEESYNFLRDLINLAQCKKRKQKQTPPQVKLTSCGKVAIRKKKETRYDSAPKRFDSDDAMASTDIGDTSNNEFSDKSYLTDVSTGWSGHQGKRAPKSARNLNAPVRPPPGLDVPPGLEPLWKALPSVSPWPETRLNAEAACFVPSTSTNQQAVSSLNPDSPCFVPSLGAVASAVDQGLSQSPDLPPKSQQLRQSIKMLKGALEEWEANLPAPNAPAALQHVNAPPGPSDNLAVLQQALTKLSPEQASMMRTFLDKKVASDSTSVLIKDALQQGVQKGSFTAAARSHPAGMQRPFTPFGTRAPSEQVKHAKNPPRTAPKNVPQSAGFDESLKDHLRDLADLDSARVLMVRRINRLGLDSPPLLKEYLTRFGNVERVMVAHTRSKAKGSSQAPRVRPAPLGFVVMSKPEEANAILAQGSEHSVHGVDIGVYSFESHTIDGIEAAKE